MDDLTKSLISQPSVLQPLLTGQLSSNTLRAYQQDLGQFFQVSDLSMLTKEMISRVTIQDVIDYRNRLLQQYKSSTVARKLSTLRTAFTYFVDTGFIAHNPAKNSWVKSPKVPAESLTEGLSQKEAEALLRQPNRESLVGKRDTAILQVMLHNGLRRSEISNLKISDLKIEGHFHILHVVGKGNKLRIVKLKPQVREAIDRYLEVRGASETDNYLFKSHSQGNVLWQKQKGRLTGESIRQLIKKYCKQAGIQKRISPHSLRHTFTTLAIDGGAKIQQVQIALGHGDPKTTMRYFRHRDQLADNATDYIHLQE